MSKCKHEVKFPNIYWEGICQKCGAPPESMDEKCTMECMPPPNMRAVEQAIAKATGDPQ